MRCVASSPALERLGGLCYVRDLLATRLSWPSARWGWPGSCVAVPRWAWLFSTAQYLSELFHVSGRSEGQPLARAHHARLEHR